MAFDRNVSVETEELDRDGRLVGKVLVNVHDVNLFKLSEV